MFLQAGEELQATTKDVEGSNHMLNEETKRAGHIKIASVSDRLKIRRRVLQGEAASQKWSKIKDAVNKTRSLCLGYLHRADEIIGDAGRYATPAPVPCHVTKWKATTPNREKVFRAPLNSAWMEAIKPDGFQHAFTFSGDATGGAVECWLLTKTHHSVGLVVSGAIETCDLEVGGAKGRLVVPFISSQTYRILGKYYSKVATERKILYGTNGLANGMHRNGAFSL